MRVMLDRRFGSGETVFVAMTATSDRAVPAGYAHLLLKPFSAGSIRAMLDTASHSPERTLPDPGVGAADPGVGAADPGVGAAAAAGAADVSPDAGLPILDRSTLEQLRKKMPGRAAGRAVCFCAGRCGGPDAAPGAVIAGECAGRLRTGSPRIKGSFGVIGARRLSALADEAEKLQTVQESFTLLSQNKVGELHTAIEQLRLMLVSLFPV